MRSGSWGMGKLAVVGISLVVASSTVMVSTRAAFNATTSNGSNSFSAGTVTLADDDANSVMFNLSNLKPNDTSTKCINVTYTGSLTSDVKLYGTVGGSGLASYVNLTVDVGTGAAGGASLSCTGFTSSTNLLSSTLAAFGTGNTNYSNGLGGFAGATNPTTRSYRVVATLQDNNLAQGKNASVTFTWEAQNTA